MTETGIVEELMALVSPTAEAMPDGERLTRLVLVADEAVAEILRLRRAAKNTPGVFLMSYEDGRHMRLSRALGELLTEMEYIASAIPDEFALDPPDGGEVKKHEAILRMVAEIKRLRAELADARREAHVNMGITRT